MTSIPYICWKTFHKSLSAIIDIAFVYKTKTSGENL